MSAKQDAERRFAQIEGERDYYKRMADIRERQLLKGLQALGIGCKSVDQCVEFEREVVGTVNVLVEDRKKAEQQRDRLKEALAAVRSDGAWIGGEWVPSADAEALADAALEECES